MTSEKNRQIARDKMREMRARRPAGRQYTSLLESRGHDRCAICGMTETAISARGRTRRLVIDHDHETGMVRDLLCNRCNAGIGYLGDDPDRAQRAADYLRQHKAAPSGIRWHGESAA